MEADPSTAAENEGHGRREEAPESAPPQLDAALEAAPQAATDVENPRVVLQEASQGTLRIGRTPGGGRTPGPVRGASWSSRMSTPANRIARSWTGAVSAWRLPQRPGELPLYVQRNFRVKTFFLLSVQLMLVFWEMVLVRFAFLEPFGLTLQGMRIVMFIFGVASLASILSMHFLQDKYPVNYILLATTTLLVGIFWGMAPMSFLNVDTYLHFQVIGILAVSMGFTTVLTALLTQKSISPTTNLMTSYVLSWAMASTIDLIIAHYWLAICSQFAVGMAAFAALVLLTGALFVDVGRLLTKCDPDNFVRIIVAMDSALLVVSMPIFLVSCCLIHADEVERAVENGDQQPQARDQDAHAPDALQMQIPV